MNIARLFAFTFITSALTACGWVDSTGAQGVNMTSSGELRNAQPLPILEDTTITAALVGEGSSLQNWQWVSGPFDETAKCMNIDGFDANVSHTSLNAACEDVNNCSLEIEEINTISGTEFQIAMPKLRAPVALSYSVTTVRADGATVTRQQPLCGLSINEAPIAEDDEYIVRRQSTRIVDATDADNLLSNDRDDIDVRNQTLSVITTPITPPQFASEFSLNTDGGFTYRVSDTAPLGESGITEDSFTYAITDGSHTVNANVSIKVIDSNEPPTQLQQIPDLLLTAANGNDDSHLRRVDLSQYFADPDNDKLTFESSEIDSSAGLLLTPEGFLVSSASSDDVSQWRANVVASDGIESVSAEFVITIRLPNELKNINRNLAPTVTDIKNRTFNGVFTYDVTEFYTERDVADQLTYTARGLPAGVQIRADGVIEGEVSAGNTGTWFVRVIAEDGYGGTVSDGFLLILR